MIQQLKHWWHGIYVFVFIIALTTSILLMTNVSKMSDSVNNLTVNINSDSMIETQNIEISNEISGTDLLKYKMQQNINIAGVNEKYNFDVKEGNNTKDLNVYLTSITDIEDLSGEKFKIKVNSKTVDKYGIVFEKQ